MKRSRIFTLVLFFWLIGLVGFSLASCTTVFVDSGKPAELKAWVWKPGRLVAEANNDLLDFQLRIYQPDLSDITIVDDGFQGKSVRDLETYYFDKPGIWRIGVVSANGDAGSVKLCGDTIGHFDRIKGGERPKGLLERLIELIRSIFGF